MRCMAKNYYRMLFTWIFKAETRPITQKGYNNWKHDNPFIYTNVCMYCSIVVNRTIWLKLFMTYSMQRSIRHVNGDHIRSYQYHLVFVLSDSTFASICNSVFHQTLTEIEEQNEITVKDR